MPWGATTNNNNQHPWQPMVMWSHHLITHRQMIHKKIEISIVRLRLRQVEEERYRSVENIQRTKTPQNKTDRSIDQSINQSSYTTSGHTSFIKAHKHTYFTEHFPQVTAK